MAKRDALPWSDIESLTLAVRAFIDPILSTKEAGEWSAANWSWAKKP